jgi:hypothetical protein
MKINKKESTTEKAPRHASKNTFDKNEDGAKKTHKKISGHVEKLTGMLHGHDPYTHVK